MSLITIDLKDILSQGVACEVIFRPKDTPFINGTALTVNANRSVRTNTEGVAEIELEPGEYEVRLEGAGLYQNPIIIGVPDDHATYPLTALIEAGTSLPNPPQLQGPPGSQILSGTGDPQPADGAVGDWWFNTATHTLFGPKTGGGWPAEGVSLQGEKVELQASPTHIQWRYEGESEWKNLLPLTDITGPQGEQGPEGRKVELQATATHLQWRYEGDVSWNNLLPLTDITGPQGPQGEPGHGIPAGGNDGQILLKDGATDYVAKWAATIPQSAVTDLVSDLAGKEPVQQEATQQEMEAGTETGIRKYSPLRIWQAINKGIGDLLSSVNTWTQNQVFNGTNNTLPNHSGLPASINTAINARQLAFESALQSLASIELSPHFVQTATANGGEAITNVTAYNSYYVRTKSGAGGKGRVFWENISTHRSPSGSNDFLSTGSVLMWARFVFVSWNPAISKGSIRFVFGDSTSTAIPDYGASPLGGSGFGFEIANNENNTAIQFRLFSRGSDNNVVYSNFEPLGIDVNNSFTYVMHVLLEYNGSTGDLKLYSGSPLRTWGYPNRTPRVTLSNSAMVGVTTLGGARVTASAVADTASPMAADYQCVLLLQKIGFAVVPQ